MKTCASCGQNNAQDARFCSACGAALGAADHLAEVRKTVTVVFTDLVGSTRLGEGLDPETLRRVMTRYFDAMQGVLERHGGTVEKFIGDAIMAVFGLPTLHEDDALRAVRAAIEMREALARKTTTARPHQQEAGADVRDERRAFGRHRGGRENDRLQNAEPRRSVSHALAPIRR